MRPDVENLRICIIGAGMGGLATALSLAKEGFKNIQVYETASDLGFVGAGIQLAPNMARILDRLGVWGDLAENATELGDLSIRDGPSDRELGNLKLDYVRATYGFPHMMAHRSELANALYNGCRRQQKAIQFLFSITVDQVDVSSAPPSFVATSRGGESRKVEADIILAADGIKSKTRVAILQRLGAKAEVIDTGQASYRIMVRRELLEHDNELLKLIDADHAIRWVGDKRMIIAYPVANKTIFNISTTQPDSNFAAAPSATYTTKGSKSSMLSMYSGFCPRVRKLLRLAPEGEICEWKLRVHQPLPTWYYGSTALVGDASHPSLPHVAQGAAQAIEDAAVLGVVLSRLPEPSAPSINKALGVYERVRKNRAETLVELAAINGVAIHLGDGAAREERDKMLAKLNVRKGESPDKFVDENTQKMMYGHDCVEVAKEEINKALFQYASS